MAKLTSNRCLSGSASSSGRASPLTHSPLPLPLPYRTRAYLPLHYLTPAYLPLHEGRICRMERRGWGKFPLLLKNDNQHKKKRSTWDFLNFLYNQVRWSSLRGSKRLKKIIYERNRQKNMSLQDKKNITTRNSNLVFWTLSARQKPLDLL